jgi:hypothetical protein
MKIAAIRGDAYIVEEADGRNGFVADVRKRVRFPRFLLMALYARGYWEAIDHDPELLAEILSFPELRFEETRGKEKGVHEK